MGARQSINLNGSAFETSKGIKFFAKKNNKKIPILTIAWLSQIKIFEKLELKQIVRLSKCCKEICELIARTRPRPVWEAFAVVFRTHTKYPYVCSNEEAAYGITPKYDYDLIFLKSEMGVRVITKRLIVKITLDETTCEYIIQEMKGLRIPSVSLESPSINCDPNSFEKMLINIQATSLHCKNGIEGNHLRLAVIKKMQRLVLLNSAIYNETLLSLMASQLVLGNCDITIYGLNRFLAQWQDGTRSVEFLRICMAMQNIDQLTISPVNLNAIEVWRPNKHGKLGSLLHWKWATPEVVYKIIRKCDDTELFIAVLGKQIKALSSETMKKYKELCFEQVN